jgi:hypothetical protein
MQREEMKLEVIVEVKVIIHLLVVVVVVVVHIEVVQEGSCVVWCGPSNCSRQQ